MIRRWKSQKARYEDKTYMPRMKLGDVRTTSSQKKSAKSQNKTGFKPTDLYIYIEIKFSPPQSRSRLTNVESQLLDPWQVHIISKNQL